MPGQLGELYIAGDAVFEGYLHRPDLTNEALFLLDDQLIYYRTGDLVRMNDSTGLLCYIGRKDFQFKLHGQRIDLGEIESVLREITGHCVVVKTKYLDDEHLVAYAETKRSEYDLRQHCLSLLPLYMVPSFFVILDKLPLNENGKIDRKALPSVDYSSLSVSPIEGDQPVTEMETKVFAIWCQILPHLTSMPSTSTSFFSLGGNSLSLMKLFRLYWKDFKQYHIDISDLFRRSTIGDHAQLLLQNQCDNAIISDCWHSLNIIQGEYATMFFLLFLLFSSRSCILCTNSNLSR
jgi:hypothetical protein